ncbi:hypothetical protein [Aquimarina agarilytica]|uniref:hypothetical protein n=1 Tax=Aquimarina agarilytica TaxID=1087449 RepID=UPI00028848E1|nr:hypothetical protein [Aquimarina agarilytica]
MKWFQNMAIILMALIIVGIFYVQLNPREMLPHNKETEVFHIEIDSLQHHVYQTNRIILKHKKHEDSLKQLLDSITIERQKVQNKKVSKEHFFDTISTMQLYQFFSDFKP